MRRVSEKFQIGKRMVYDKMSFRELIIAFFAHWTGYASGGRKSGISGNPTALRLENYLCEHYEEWTKGGYGDDLEFQLMEKVMEIEKKYGEITYASAFNIGRRIQKAWPEIEQFLETTKMINDKAEYRYMSREEFLNMFKNLGEAKTISFSELRRFIVEGISPKITQQDDMSKIKFDEYSGTNYESAVRFLEKVIDKIPEWKNYKFELFYSGNAGFAIYNEDNEKIGHLMYDKTQYGLEDAMRGRGWYLRMFGGQPTEVESFDKWKQIVRMLALDDSSYPEQVRM